MFKFFFEILKGDEKRINESIDGLIELILNDEFKKSDIDKILIFIKLNLYCTSKSEKLINLMILLLFKKLSSGYLNKEEVKYHVIKQFDWVMQGLVRCGFKFISLFVVRELYAYLGEKNQSILIGNYLEIHKKKVFFYSLSIYNKIFKTKLLLRRGEMLSELCHIRNTSNTKLCKCNDAENRGEKERRVNILKIVILVQLKKMRVISKKPIFIQ